MYYLYNGYKPNWVYTNVVLNLKIILNKNQIIRLISISAVVISLTQDAVCINSRCVDSLTAFLMGWMMIVAEGANYAWLANPLLIISIITLSKNLKLSIILSLSALFFGLLPLIYGEMSVDEAGTPRQIKSYEIGYWLWLSGMITMIIGITTELVTEKLITTKNKLH